MNRLLLGAALWFYAGWYATAMTASMLHAPSGLGPLGGAVVAAVVLTRLVTLWRRGRAPAQHRYRGAETAVPPAV